MGKIKTRRVLGLAEAYQSTFVETKIGEMKTRRSSGGKKILGDGQGHEVSQTRLLNALWDATNDKQRVALGLSVNNGNKGLELSIADDSKIQKVGYSRDEEGTDVFHDLPQA